MLYLGWAVNGCLNMRVLGGLWLARRREMGGGMLWLSRVWGIIACLLAKICFGYLWLRYYVLLWSTGYVMVKRLEIRDAHDTRSPITSPSPYKCPLLSSSKDQTTAFPFRAIITTLHILHELKQLDELMVDRQSTAPTHPLPL